MPFKKPNSGYWDRKMAAYLHDPLDKAYKIQGHEERAAKLLKAFGLDKPNDAFWRLADGIASGFERGQVPSYYKDENKSGAVNLVTENRAVITHPIGENGALELNVPHADADKISTELQQFLLDTIGNAPEKGGYSNKFPDDPDRFAMARFLYLHLALRFKLAEENVAGLGALWHRLPADTRFPDHSIWQHNALVSALSSCMETTGDENNIGLMVFSITPVQSFISTARKLRDYWSGSVMLSWLAFEGLRWVMENLGPDHVLYPSLVDQPLVNEYLQKNWDIDNIRSLAKIRDIASLPNKFVVLIPFSQAKEIGAEVQKVINKAWAELMKKSESFLIAQLGLSHPPEISHLQKMFRDQSENYWDIQWSAVRLLGADDLNEFARLLPETAYEKQMGLLNILHDIVAQKYHLQKSGKGTLYSVSHHLVQGVLAGKKMQRQNKRKPQTGEKCVMCGAFEALHAVGHSETQSAATYKKHVTEFWKKLSEKDTMGREIRENERLCALCYTKRMGYRIIKDDPVHILNATFKDAEGFPSTTEMALHAWFRRNKVESPKLKKDLAQTLHDREEGNRFEGRLDNQYSKPEDKDKYLAVLMMDGDKMGKLINGETIGASWEKVMHPEIYRRLTNVDFDPLYRKNWQKIFDNYPNRFITPSIHAAISEALADFSIYGVHPIVKKYGGRLIYAGGDDVCAIFPLENAMPAAREIRDFYRSSFKWIQDGRVDDIIDGWRPQPGKMAVMLGRASQISISAGLLIFHHKENLKEMIQRAHTLLDTKAKEQGGRDALALELKKRSGGSRYVTAKWDNDIWKNMEKVQMALAGEEKELSRSLLYRISAYSDGLYHVLNHPDKEMPVRFISQLMEKSGLRTQEKRIEIAHNVSTILTAESNKIDADGLIIAAFLAEKEAR
ncbi:MAG: type III-B CRISPR-associated protein Cas10/Cmr2 [Calditrichaeota bacterium]|nr:MAG: type III-B CRISPR-associated protein Cas10/Cmr2 [Calditrichota bacterium]